MIQAAIRAAPALLLTFVALTAYVGTMAPGVLGGDSGELQFVSPILGLTHPTGYPLLVLVNHVWGRLIPLGSVAWRITLLNAAFAACAIGVLVLVGRRVTGSTLASVVGAAFLAFAPIYWSQATGSDKYMLNALLLAFVILAALQWAKRPSEARLGLLALVYGLSLTNHRSMLLAAPALAVFVLLSGWRPRHPSRLLAPILLAVLPLALYLYVPWAGGRGLPPGTWPVGTPGELLEYFLDRGYTSQIQVDSGSVARTSEFARVSLLQVGPAGIVLGLIGALFLLLRQPRVFLLIGLILAPTLIAAANYLLPSNYAIPRFWVFFIPVYLCWAIFIAAGVAALFSLTRHVSLPSRLRDVSAVVSIAVLAAGATVWVPAGVIQARAHRSAETLDGYRQDLQRGNLADRFARLSLQESGPDAIIVGDWEQSTALWYMQYVEGIRPDIVVRYPIERLDATLDDASFAQRPVYITRALPGVERLGPTSAVGPLIQARGSPATRPETPATQVDANFGQTARLVGVRYLADGARVGTILPIVLYWEAIGSEREDASVSVRLVSDSGEDLAQSDAPHPVLGTSPMHQWVTGTTIRDYHELAVSNRMSPGDYRVEVLLYRGPSATPLAVTGGDANDRADRVRLPSIQVRP